MYDLLQIQEHLRKAQVEAGELREKFELQAKLKRNVEDELRREQAGAALLRQMLEAWSTGDLPPGYIDMTEKALETDAGKQYREDLRGLFQAAKDVMRHVAYHPNERSPAADAVKTLIESLKKVSWP